MIPDIVKKQMKIGGINKRGLNTATKICSICCRIFILQDETSANPPNTQMLQQMLHQTRATANAPSEPSHHRPGTKATSNPLHRTKATSTPLHRTKATSNPLHRTKATTSPPNPTKSTTIATMLPNPIPIRLSKFFAHLYL